ncbi:MAG: hypothetical protein WDW38_004887 [Sanguina aurantia]
MQVGPFIKQEPCNAGCSSKTVVAPEYINISDSEEQGGDISDSEEEGMGAEGNTQPGASEHKWSLLQEVPTSEDLPQQAAERQQQQQQLLQQQQQQQQQKKQQQNQQQDQHLRECKPLPEMNSSLDVSSRLETVSDIMIIIFEWLQPSEQAEGDIINALESWGDAELGKFVGMYAWLKRACLQNNAQRARELVQRRFNVAL